MRQRLIGFAVLLFAPVLLLAFVVRAFLEVVDEIGLRAEMWWDDLPFVKWKRICKPCYDLKLAQGAHWAPDHRPEACPRRAESSTRTE